MSWGLASQTASAAVKDAFSYGKPLYSSSFGTLGKVMDSMTGRAREAYEDKFYKTGWHDKPATHKFKKFGADGKVENFETPKMRTAGHKYSPDGTKTPVEVQATERVKGRHGKRSYGNLAMNQLKEAGTNAKWAVGVSSAMYGLSAYMADDSSMDAADRMYSAGKYATAGALDAGVDMGIGAIGAGLGMLGPMGAAVGTVLNLGNMAAGFMGLDAGSLALKVFDKAEEQYNNSKHGPKFNMSANTSMALQRQIQNLHASGSNLGEMMHN